MSLWTDTVDGNPCGHGFTDSEDMTPNGQSPRYDLNDNKCIWGEPDRDHLFIGGKKADQGGGKQYCVHRYTGPYCTCYSEAFTVTVPGMFYVVSATELS